jgi:serine protease Do/serine protease DegQ
VVGVSVKGTVQNDQQNNPLLQDPFFRRFFDLPDQPRERQFQAAGSGVIVDAANGYILTNAHVVENAKEITVTLLDNREIKAQVKGVDQGSDIAVLQVKAPNLTAIPLADSSKAQVGDFVIAIGNPFGLEHTVTSGIISALSRAPGISDNGYEDFIQTDASINPGNSGGALLDLNGQLVGVNSAIFSSSGGNIGIGFAIPSNMAKSVMEQLVKYGKVQRGELGVRMQTLPPNLAGSVGAETTGGALVSEVLEGSAAEKAGVKSGDIITSVNGNPVRTGQALKNAIGSLRVGDKVEIGVLRDGKPRKLTATIAERSESASKQAAAEIHSGLEGADFSDGKNGVTITAVAENSPAAGNGLRRNDVIVAVGRMPVTSVQQLREAVKGANEFLLTIQRGNRTLVAVIR